MYTGRIALFALALVTPFSIELHAQGDTLATLTAVDGTQIEVIGGTGSYAFLSRGCNGNVIRRHPASFHEAATRVEVPIGSGGVRLGVRAGIVRDDFAGGDGNVTLPVLPPSFPEPERVLSTNRYVNPYFSFEPPGGSFGLGWVKHEHDFPTAGEGAREQADHPLNSLSAHLRFGPESRYFEMRWMEGMPLYADGGYLSLGTGGRAGNSPWTAFWGLAAGGPYEGAGLALRVGCETDVGVRLNARARLGMSGGSNASGIAVGLGWTGRRR